MQAGQTIAPAEYTDQAKRDRFPAKTCPRLFCDSATFVWKQKDSVIKPPKITKTVERDRSSAILRDKKAERHQTKQQKSSDHDENNMRLLRAAASGDIQQARQAIEQGADIDCCDHNNHTPQHLACSRSHAAFVDFLVSIGAKNDTKCMQDSSGVAKSRSRLPLAKTCRNTEPTCGFRRCQSQSSTLSPS